MGPLARMWSILEKAIQSKEEHVSVSLTDLQQYMEQTILMIGQSSNTVTYHRRYNLLNSLLNSLTNPP